MNRKSYFDFIIIHYGKYLSDLGYSKIYQAGTGISFEKANAVLSNRVGLDITMYDTINLSGILWELQYKELDKYFIRTILTKENRSEKDIKGRIKSDASFRDSISLTTERTTINIYSYQDAEQSFEVIRNYIEKEAEPFFAKYSQLRNVYEFLINSSKEVFWEKAGGTAIFYRELFIYKIYNEEKYQQYLKELANFLEERNYKSYKAAFSELVDYIENNVTRLREIYAPEML